MKSLHQSGGNLQVKAVDFHHFIGYKAVAAAVFCMEVRNIAAETDQQRTGFIRVFDAELRMIQGRLNLL